MEDKYASLIVGAAAGLFWGSMIGMNLYNRYSSRVIPNERNEQVQVEEGFVSPSKLEIELRDVDGDGKSETLMKYDGDSYLMRLDEQGEAKVQSYKISPI